jgi:hypothetical protein
VVFLLKEPSIFFHLTPQQGEGSAKESLLPQFSLWKRKMICAVATVNQGEAAPVRKRYRFRNDSTYTVGSEPPTHLKTRLTYFASTDQIHKKHDNKSYLAPFVYLTSIIGLLPNFRAAETSGPY